MSVLGLRNLLIRCIDSVVFPFDFKRTAAGASESSEILMRRCYRIAQFSLIVLFCSHNACALEPVRSINELQHTSWTAKDGAPSNVRALAQTTDGYLWLGGSNGLYRFDGVRFAQFKAPSARVLPAVSSLLADADGSLWVGFGDGGGGVMHLKEGHTVFYEPENNLPHGRIYFLAKTRSGVVWAGAEGGLARFVGENWAIVGQKNGFTGRARSGLVDRQGRLWVGTDDKLLVLEDGLTRFELEADGLGQVSGIFQGPDDRIWMAETEQSVHPLITRETNSFPQLRIRVGSLAGLFNRDGSLWITTLGDGIRRISYPEHLHTADIGRMDRRAEHFTMEDGLSGDLVLSILQDSKGNIWLGSSAGIDRFRRADVVTVPIPSAIGIPSFSIVAGEKGRLIVLGGSRKPFTVHNEQINPFREPPTWQSISAAYRASNGVIWTGGTNPNSKNHHPPANLMSHFGGRSKRIDLPNHGEDVSAITSDHVGRLWVSIRRAGCFRREAANWRSLESMGGTSEAANTAYTDRGGTTWFGFNENKIASLKGDALSLYTIGGDGQVGDITAISECGSGICIGGKRGLAFFDGRAFTAMPSSDGNNFTHVSGMVNMPKDGVWIAEARGIVRISEDEIERMRREPSHQPSYRLFDSIDGLRDSLQSTPPFPTEVLGTDGKLWFATNKGVAWIDPQHISLDSVPPPVRIENISANGKIVPLSTMLSLPALTTDIHVTYAGLDLSKPERVRFRYRLDGLDQDWQDADARREAFYTNLGPGSYRFRVLACNGDGVWSEAGASLSFTIAPAFYQTIWFKLLCGLAAALLLWWGYLARTSKVAHQIQSRMNDRMREREQIARDLHDTLMQGFQGLMLRFHATLKQIPLDGPAHQMMETALDRADEVLAEGRERIGDLRASGMSTPDLVQSMRDCGAELLRDSGASFNIYTVGTETKLEPWLQGEAYLIGREALRNAFRHSNASKIEVELTYQRVGVTLRVRDDGVGIDLAIQSQGRPGHWGLIGMRERAEKMGAELIIWSSPGAGTEIDLKMPRAPHHVRKTLREG